MDKENPLELVPFRQSCAVFPHFSQQVFRCGYIQDSDLVSALKLKDFYQIHCNIDLRSEKEAQDSIFPALLKQIGIDWVQIINRFG